MTRFLSIALVVGAIVASGTARAQYNTTTPTHVFTTIDAVLRQTPSNLFLKGVLADAAQATEVQVRINGGSAYQSLDSCERAAVLMMNRPGQYRLEVWSSNSSYYPLSYCRLSLANP